MLTVPCVVYLYPAVLCMSGSWVKLLVWSMTGKCSQCYLLCTVLCNAVPAAVAAIAGVGQLIAGNCYPNPFMLTVLCAVRCVLLCCVDTQG
jgi:hypothetical protein